MNPIDVRSITFNFPGIKKRDYIHCVLNSKGQKVHDQKHILDECRFYYQELYKQPVLSENKILLNKYLSKVPRNALSSVANCILGEEISQKELLEALQNMKKDAVSGEDGLTVRFYLTYWEELKELLFEAYQYGFDSGHLSITQRRGLIRLVPKRDRNPLLISSWRPISLLNVDYKALTKLFSTHLAKFLPELIHQDQRGFVKKRSIHDNILDVQAILTACDNLDTEGMLILLDIQKAFDTIGWAFIRAVLIQYSFPPYFIRWFEIFYTGKELHVLNNGFMSQAIFPARGVAQGCGISPLYFILALEVLAIAIRDDPRIIGMEVLGITKKLNLLADDGLLTLRWAQETFTTIVEILREFGEISGLHVNQHKSLIVQIGQDTNRPLLDGMEYFPSSVDGIFKYLGIEWRRRVTRHTMVPNFETEFAQIKTIAHERNDPLHTLLGRILNVKSLMVSKLTYKFKSIPAPLTAWLHQVQKFLIHYVWSFRLHGIHQEHLYLPVKEGGLHLVDLLTYEKSLKIAWLDIALHSENTFWVTHLRSCIKIPLRELLTANIAWKDVKYVCIQPLSDMWKCVLKYWCDYHFVADEGNIALMPLAYNSAFKMHNVFSQEFVNSTNVAGIHTVLDLIDQFPVLTPLIKRQFPANRLMNRMPKRWLEQAETGDYGEVAPLETLLLKRFNVRTVYNELRSAATPPPPVCLAKWQRDLEMTDLSEHWSSICSHVSHIVKVSMKSFYIKFVNRVYYMNTRVAHFNASQMPKCSFCGREDETYMHAFWYCIKIQPLWQRLIEWCKLNICNQSNYSRNNCLLLGFPKPVLNNVVTVCKLHIFLLRFTKHDYSFDSLLKRILDTRRCVYNAYTQLPYLSVSAANKLWNPMVCAQKLPRNR